MTTVKELVFIACQGHQGYPRKFLLLDLPVIDETKRNETNHHFSPRFGKDLKTKGQHGVKVKTEEVVPVYLCRMGL
jgi:hypothetical protein